ncbi:MULTISPECIES: aldo/keto reductase [unclassified Sphingobacterium]|uniref:aldo/keto reductase n=1 Tax=unclassified Sphingobacterium TaxID=2609468 RepID=UPI0029548A11|nr:aldo/keto reductase [Sphingobacterium sp. UGAL515B_05]WON93716.1 aldo/keto reductase [Sphingobacterium sp. UGAL515B_05]
MKTRKLGTQGLEIPMIGLGCMGMSSFASTGDIYGKANEKESIATIHRSLELGGNFLDTADLYGPFENERLISRAICGKRNDYILASKFGFEIDDNDQVTWRINGRPEYIRKSIERSLKNLDTDVIDLYYMHRPDPNVPIEETVGAMGELVTAGKVRYLGISEVSAEQISKAHATFPITAVQNEISLFGREVEINGVYNLTQELGIGLVAYSPLGRGFITGEIKSPDDIPEDDFRRLIPRFQGEQFYKNLDLVRELEQIGKEKDVTSSQLALAWLIQKGIVPIPGTKRVRYVEQNIAATDILLTAEDLQRIEAILPVGLDTGSRDVSIPLQS